MKDRLNYSNKGRKVFLIIVEIEVDYNYSVVCDSLDSSIIRFLDNV